MLILGKFKVSTICAFRILILTALTTFTTMAKDSFFPEKVEEYTEMARPLHAPEYAAGESMTLAAIPVNPTETGRFFCYPSIGRVHAHLGHGFNVLDVGDLYEDLETVFKVRTDDDSPRLQDLELRFLPVKAVDLKKDWLPAINPGIHSKFNLDIEDDKRVGYKLYGTKTFDSFSRSIVVNQGLRSTPAFEYRMMPDDSNEIKGMSDSSGHAWDFSATYTFARRFNIVVGYGYMGEIDNHTANRTFGISIKYVF